MKQQNLGDSPASISREISLIQLEFQEKKIMKKMAGTKFEVKYFDSLNRFKSR